MKANTHIAIKREDILKYLTDNQVKGGVYYGVNHDAVRSLIQSPPDYHGLILGTSESEEPHTKQGDFT